MTTQPSYISPTLNPNEHNKKSTDKHDKVLTEVQDNNQFKQSLEALFNPFIRVVPERDWSKIKAIWIPFLHHDYKHHLEKSDQIKIVHKEIDKFGTIQGYLLAENENYIPYLTTFFNPIFTQDQVIAKILQADQNILETEQILIDQTSQAVIRKTIFGVAKSGMLISIIKNQDDKIIDAFPIFHKDQL